MRSEISGRLYFYVKREKRVGVLSRLVLLSQMFLTRRRDFIGGDQG
ncbi:hypothetical protein BH18ACI2_BH18ACI2_10760 [soil metagenome]